MVSHTTCTSSEGARAYFAKHLQTGDYFRAQDAGEWHGNLAHRFGLEGKAITAEKFSAFVEADTIALSGDESLKRPRQSERKYQEFTYTAPKGFSVAAACDERLKAQLFGAVKEELSWLEGFAAVRDRRGSLAQGEVSRATGNMMTALFQHETSRTNDPNFHVHALIGNLSFDPDRQQVLALDYKNLMELRKTLDARINNNLAARCSALGYTVEVAEHGFALREVSKDAMDLFSARQRQVEGAQVLLKAGYSVEQLAQTAERLGNVRGEVFEKPAVMRAALSRVAPANAGARIADHDLHERAVLLTRPKKIEISGESLRADVATRLERAGIEVKVPSSRTASPPLPREEQAAVIKKAIEQAVETVFERSSVLRLDELGAEVVRLAPGLVSNAEIAAALRDDSRFLVGRLANGPEMVTTRANIAEERELLSRVSRGLNNVLAPVVAGDRYKVPAELEVSPERIAEMLRNAKAKGEEMTASQAETWLQQFQNIHRYVTTSQHQFLNVRGGAGVGKTFALEALVSASLDAGRQVILTAPYGEQARVTMRAEAERLERNGKTEVGNVFKTANTVDWLLTMAEKKPEFAAALKGSDIFVDEAGLLDSTKALALVRLAQQHDCRLIFQGDVQQMAAVGRGTPIQLLQERLGLGMSVERASISRRQLKGEDKQIAMDLSSGDDRKFNGALEKLIGRGDVTTKEGTAAIVENAADKIIAGREAKTDMLVVSSVHRLADGVSDRIHALTVEANPDTQHVEIASHKSKELTPAELLSSQFYHPGDVVEYDRQSGRQSQGAVESVSEGGVRIRENGRLRTVALADVKDVLERRMIERTVGAKLLLTGKVKQGKQVFENKSVQTLKAIEGNTLFFESGLRLDRMDGRLRQGDVLTTYKAQGAKADSVLIVEDNKSLEAMANRKAIHVLFTRHVSKVEMLVESHAVLRDTAQRTQAQMGALDFVEAVGVRPPPLPAQAAAAQDPTQAVDLEEVTQPTGTSILQDMIASPGSWLDDDLVEIIPVIASHELSDNIRAMSNSMDHTQSNDQGVTDVEARKAETRRSLEEAFRQNPEQCMSQVADHIDDLYRAGMDTQVAEWKGVLNDLRQRHQASTPGEVSQVEGLQASLETERAELQEAIRTMNPAKEGTDWHSDRVNRIEQINGMLDEIDQDLETNKGRALSVEDPFTGPLSREEAFAAHPEQCLQQLDDEIAAARGAGLNDKAAELTKTLREMEVRYDQLWAGKEGVSQDEMMNPEQRERWHNAKSDAEREQIEKEACEEIMADEGEELSMDELAASFGQDHSSPEQSEEGREMSMEELAASFGQGNDDDERAAPEAASRDHSLGR